MARKRRKAASSSRARKSSIRTKRGASKTRKRGRR